MSLVVERVQEMRKTECDFERCPAEAEYFVHVQIPLTTGEMVQARLRLCGYHAEQVQKESA